MNRIFNTGLLVLTCIFVLTTSLKAQQKFTLEDIIQRAKNQSPSSKWAETRKENRFWAYRSFRTNYNPQLRLEGELPVYYKSVNQIPQPDGTYRYRPVEQTNNEVTLGLRQPLSWTGGSLSANSGLGFFKDYNDESLQAEQWGGSVFYVQLIQPFFAFNPLRWDKKIEPLVYEESKKPGPNYLTAI